MDKVHCGDIARYLELSTPPELAAEWDNVGLLIGTTSQEITNVMVCVDVTTDIINECVANFTNLIISHHPLIFGSLHRIVFDNPIGEMISRLIKNNISLYCMHTNLDAAPNGTNQFLANQMELQSVENAPCNELGNFCKIGALKIPQNIDDFIEFTKKCLCIDSVRVVGTTEKKIRNVAVMGGSFAPELISCLRGRVDIIVTGDIKHHAAIEMLEYGICAIDAGHYDTEKLVVDNIIGVLQNKYPTIKFHKSKFASSPFRYS